MDFWAGYFFGAAMGIFFGQIIVMVTHLRRRRRP
jgi:hypothetical protein